MAAVRQIWERLTLNQRLLMGTIGGALILAVVLFMSWARQPDYTVLYANVAPEDAGEIVDQLQSQGIPHKLSDGGRTILVPSKHVYESRLDLAVQGLPESGSVGYEIFDKTGLGVTDFVQRLNFQRALEGEIGRSIQSLNEVRSARVHIVLPEESLFVADQKEATASVVLRLRGSLSQGQVSGITRLVAASVEGLLPINVTVVDTFGNLLSRPNEGDSFAAVSSRQHELKTQVEGHLRQKVTTMLEGVLGRGKVVAQIDADLDFERIERTVESYDSDTPAVRSEQRIKGSEEEGAKSENILTNYELSKTLEHIVSPVGGIQKLTAAVLVDGVYEIGEDGERRYTPRSPEEMERLRGIIRTAIGYDDARGDLLEVHNVAFENDDTLAEVQAIDQADRMDLLLQIGNRVGQVLVILLIALLIRNFYRKTTGAIQTHARSIQDRRAQEAAIMAVPSEDEKYFRMQEEIAQLVHQRPEEISQLIRTWLKED